MARSAARPVTTLSTVIRSLSAESDAACLLDAQGTYLFVNGAWDRLVAAQGGAEQGDQLVGRSWIDRYAGGDLKRIHAQLLERVVRGEGTGPGRAVVLVEEHNTPTRARLFATRLQPVETGGELLGVAVVQRLVRERPIDEVYGAVDRPDRQRLDQPSDLRRQPDWRLRPQPRPDLCLRPAEALFHR